MILKIDHVMFPFYNNNKLLNEIKKHYDNLGYASYIEPKKKTFKGLYLLTKRFYVEHLSTIKGEHNWTNALCIVLDKKYWGYFKNPDMINEHFLIPKFRCGYFLVDPKSPYVNWKKTTPKNKFNINNLTILISKKLENKLKHLAGYEWELPNYIQTDKRLCQLYDILITANDRVIAPLFHSNIPI